MLQRYGILYKTNFQCVNMHTRIRCFTLVVCVLLMIPTAAFADSAIQLGVPFQLGFNQTVTIDRLQIKFANVIQDSRCPSDVTCIWQGQAKIIVNIKTNSQDLGNFTLISGNDNKLTVQTFDHYYIQLMNIDPYPVSTKKIQLSDYVVNLKLFLLPPLKQLKSGISHGELTCMQGFSLVMKSEDNSPACVKSDSISKLVARGWALSVSYTQSDLGTGNDQNQIVTLGQNGQTIQMHKGNNFLLKLGKDFDWNISLDNQTVVSRVPNIMVMDGAQGIFVAHNVGDATLSAVGDPWCRHSATPCMIHSILFRVNVLVLT